MELYWHLDPGLRNRYRAGIDAPGDQLRRLRLRIGQHQLGIGLRQRQPPLHAPMTVEKYSGLPHLGSPFRQSRDPQREARQLDVEILGLHARPGLVPLHRGVRQLDLWHQEGFVG